MRVKTRGIKDKEGMKDIRQYIVLFYKWYRLEAKRV